MRRLWIVTALVAPGCGGRGWVDTPSELPPGYVAIDRGRHEWRGISAEGVVVGLRSFDREPAATLAFWSKVVQQELEGTKGYVVEGEEAVTCASGQPGTLLRFSAPRAESTAYALALFPADRRIFVLEAAGPRAPLEKDLPLLRAFAAALKLP
jgi:hypothetical protein